MKSHGNNKFSWFRNRRYQLTSYVFDIWLFILIVNLKPAIFQEYGNLLYLIGLWLLWGYLIGRYYNPNIKNNGLLKQLITTLLTLFFTLSCYLISEFITLFSFSYSLDKTLLLNKLLLFSAISVFLQYIINKILLKESNRKNWIYIGKKSTFDYLINESKIKH